MTRARRDAMARLDAAVMALAGPEPDETLPLYLQNHWRAYRRALRALLRVIAQDADNAVIAGLHKQGMTPLADIGDEARISVLGKGGKR